jgi:hypothetical protein
MLDFLIPNGEAVANSVMDVALELSATLATIIAFHDVLKGTLKFNGVSPTNSDPFNGVSTTNSGLLVHGL